MTIGTRGLLGASGATALGVLVVVFGVHAVEAKIPAPKFSLRGERFDLSTIKGRFAKQLTNCDPTTLLAREPDIRKAQDLIERFKTKNQCKMSDADLWSARKLVESCVHPDTKEIIPKPFRMAGYVPFNGPVCVAMLISGSTPALLFWNWVNQSQNALVNYYNRNASSPISNEMLLMSYSAAVGAALTVAFGLSQVIAKKFSPPSAAKLMKFVAFPSSIVASCSNCYIMRRPEIESGVTLIDADGNVLADGLRSSVAARKAVEETVISRALLPVPVFFVPALAMTLPHLAALAAAYPAIGISVSTLITIVSFGFGLPAAIAYFPQIGSLPVVTLEPEIRKKLDAKVEVVFYNKGL
jgi:tricarboxylate carrier